MRGAALREGDAAWRLFAPHGLTVDGRRGEHVREFVNGDLTRFRERSAGDLSAGSLKYTRRLVSVGDVNRGREVRRELPRQDEHEALLPGVSDRSFHAPREGTALAERNLQARRLSEVPEDRESAEQFSLPAHKREGGHGDTAVDAVGTREVDDGVHGSTLEKRYADRQVLERSRGEELWPLGSGELANFLERHTVHRLGGLIEEDEVAFRVEQGDRNGEVGRHLPGSNENEALLPGLSDGDCHAWSGPTRLDASDVPEDRERAEQLPLAAHERKAGQGDVAANSVDGLVEEIYVVRLALEQRHSAG